LLSSFSIPELTGAATALNLLFSPVAYLIVDQVYEVIEKVIGNVLANCEFLCSVERSALLGAVFGMFLAGRASLRVLIWSWEVPSSSTGLFGGIGFNLVTAISAPYDQANAQRQRSRLGSLADPARISP
jgi:hypothetical protein